MKLNRHAYIALIASLLLGILFFLSYWLHNRLSGPSNEPTVFLSIFYLLIFILPLCIIYTIIVLIIAAHKETLPPAVKKKEIDEVD